MCFRVIASPHGVAPHEFGSLRLDGIGEAESAHRLADIMKEATQHKPTFRSNGARYTLEMILELPQKLSALSPERMGQVADARDARISALFGRWPSLSEAEARELKKLYNERLRVARSLGAIRRRRLLRRGFVRTV